MKFSALYPSPSCHIVLPCNPIMALFSDLFRYPVPFHSLLFLPPFFVREGHVSGSKPNQMQKVCEYCQLWNSSTKFEDHLVDFNFSWICCCFPQGFHNTLTCIMYGISLGLSLAQNLNIQNNAKGMWVLRILKFQYKIWGLFGWFSFFLNLQLFYNILKCIIMQEA